METEYQLTTADIAYIASISEKVGILKGKYEIYPQIDFKKNNLIKTLQVMLEDNSLRLNPDQIAEVILDNKKLQNYISKDSLEYSMVQGLVNAYSYMEKYKLYKPESLYKALSLLDGKKVENMNESVLTVFETTLKNSNGFYLLRLTEFCFHLFKSFPLGMWKEEIAEIWLMLMFYDQHKLLLFMPFQKLGYKYLHDPKTENSLAVYLESYNHDFSVFKPLFLGIVDECLTECLAFHDQLLNPGDRVSFFRGVIKGSGFTRKVYMEYNRDISTATASRDLRVASEMGVLKKYGDGRRTYYQFEKKDSIGID
ncbi:hypothetical protein [Dysgonomonas sp. ZJ709]|uniref:hypothetical protein n=1 Tax=Dysgonomonas sp. ZJ709 TaxID=2709797 RepID=UPI0013EC8A8E|nr:hypothetical protein [Dysgonomonas sp. ZJ709]